MPKDKQDKQGKKTKQTKQAKQKKVKLLIAGSRNLHDYKLIDKAILFAGIDKDNIKEVVHGGAKGIDSLAGKWAENHGIPVKVFLADWKNLRAKECLVKTNQYGSYNAKAGFNRNVKMAEYADESLAIWQNGATGTEHMIETMKKYEKPYCVYELDDETEKKDIDDEKNMSSKSNVSNLPAF